MAFKITEELLVTVGDARVWADVDFVVTPAMCEISPRFGHGGFPAEPAEVELMDIVCQGQSITTEVSQEEIGRLCEIVYEAYCEGE